MKTILTFLSICFAFDGFSQTIVYDYQSKKRTVTDSQCVKIRSNVRYQITNINTFAKKVTINGNLVALNTEAPKEIEALFRLKTESAEKSLENTQEQVNKMDRIANQVSDQAKNSAAKDSKAAVDKEAALTADLVTKCNRYYYTAKAVQEALAFEKRMAEIMADESHYEKNKMLAALNDQKINQIAIDQLHDEFEEFETAYDSVYLQYGRAGNAARIAKNDSHAEEIKNAQNQVEKEYKTLEKQFEDALRNIDMLFAKASNPASYVVTSAPIHVKDDTDEVEFEVRVGNPKDDFSKLRSFNPIVHVKGGPKIDYSVGAILKFISDDKYSFDADSKLQKDANDFGTLGIASMAHIYPRSCGNVSLGGLFGINAGFKEITDVDLGLLGGVSLVFGRSRKAFISTGVSLSKVARLKDSQFKVGSTYEDVKIEDVTGKILKPSFFIAFSFAIAKRTVLKTQTE